MKLYYYTAAECAYDDFDHERIKVSTLGSVNDPNEWLPVFTNVEGSEHVPAEFARAFVMQHWGTRFGFVSLSRRWDIAPMWGIYADKYKGVVFELEMTDDSNAIPVKYCRDRHVCRPITDKEEFYKFVGTKSAAWSFEEEVRYIRQLNNDYCWKDKNLYFGPMYVISPCCDQEIRLERIICGAEMSCEMLSKFRRCRDEYANVPQHGRFIPIVTTNFDQMTYDIKEVSEI